MTRWRHRIFRAVKLLCKILYWWTHVITRLSKPTEGTAPRVSCKLWTLGDYHVSVRVISFNECTALV